VRLQDRPPASTPLIIESVVEGALPTSVPMASLTVVCWGTSVNGLPNYGLHLITSWPIETTQAATTILLLMKTYLFYTVKERRGGHCM